MENKRILTGWDLRLYPSRSHFYQSMDATGYCITFCRPGVSGISVEMAESGSFWDPRTGKQPIVNSHQALLSLLSFVCLAGGCEALFLFHCSSSQYKKEDCGSFCYDLMLRQTGPLHSLIAQQVENHWEPVAIRQSWHHYWWWEGKEGKMRSNPRSCSSTGALLG